MAADPRQPHVVQRQEAEEGFRDKERVRERFQGANFFFLSVAAKVFFFFFLVRISTPLECGFEGSRGIFRALLGSLARAKSGHFAKDILQKLTFAHVHFQNPFPSAPGSLQSDFRIPLGPPWEPSWSPELPARPSARAKTRLTFGIDSIFTFRGYF